MRLRESEMIRCMGCRRLFFELEAYWDHKKQAAHPDQGEYYVEVEG